MDYVDYKFTKYTSEHVIFDKMNQKGSVLWSTLNMIPTSY